ncbi:MAG: putative baseplate assembly protein [Methanosarcinaceae archaeon]
MTLPKEDLDNKTFEELLEEALTRIPIYSPEWTDHNLHDPGITLIELFSWLVEMQIYSLNRITEKNYRKFLKLMGVTKLEPAKPAVVDLTFSSRPGPLTIEEGTEVSTWDPVSGENIPFSTTKSIEVTDASLVKVLSRPVSEVGESTFVDNSHANKDESMDYYAFRAGIPQVGDELYLGFDKSLKGREITLAFYLSEADLSKTSIKLTWEYYAASSGENGNWEVIEIDEKKDETKQLTRSGKIAVKIEGEMRQLVIDSGNNEGDEALFWIRCRLEDTNKISQGQEKNAGYENSPKIDTILLNTVSAIQKSGEKEYIFSSPGLPDFYVDLKDSPVLDETLCVKIASETNSEGGVWEKVEDFDASEPDDTHYTFDPVKGRITFGNGKNGRIPPAGDKNIHISYHAGGGRHGNVKPRSVNTVLDGELSGKVTVDNLKAATEGKDAETLEEAIFRVRKDLKTPYRAVTTDDYEHLALNTPGIKVARAKAIPGYHPIRKDAGFPGIISVIVVPFSQNLTPVPSREFRKAVYEHLEKHRPLATELFVKGPSYISVSVEADVVIKPRYLKGDVETRVEEAVKGFLSPIKGGPGGNGWPFGRNVYISEIYQLIDGVEGVDYVKSLNFGPDPESLGDKTIEIPAHYLVYPGELIISAEEISAKEVSVEEISAEED